MIIVYHNGVNVLEVDNTAAFSDDKMDRRSIASVLVDLSKKHPREIIIWCHQDLKEQLNVSEIKSLFHHNKLLLSYNPSNVNYIDPAIGYVDSSLFVQINKSVPFPTWQMSPAVGGVRAEVLLALNDAMPLYEKFDYFLCSLGKLLMPNGLLCYSEPRLLKSTPNSIAQKTSHYTLFRFVKQHYRIRWVFLLLFDLFLYERKFSFLPFLFSLFYKSRTKLPVNLDAIGVQSSKKVIDKTTVDVIIPTISRKDFLYDILKDLKAQTYLPTKVIIVEQNPVKGSTSELDYLTTEEWPFEIRHIFTHQIGACNARNIALKQITSEWVFFADDDIRIGSNFMQSALEQIAVFGIKGVTFRCFQKGEKQIYSRIAQWGTFGSGCSLVSSDSIKNCNFKLGYEFGFGEDADFGMQLRSTGCDVLYFPEPEILHLKALSGGFRTKPILQWQKDSIQPKPSPTVMLYQLENCTTEQTNGYKTTLFFKYYRKQPVKNPFRYYKHFQEQWDRSVFWANKLKQENEI